MVNNQNHTGLGAVYVNLPQSGLSSAVFDRAVHEHGYTEKSASISARIRYHNMTEDIAEIAGGEIVFQNREMVRRPNGQIGTESDFGLVVSVHPDCVIRLSTYSHDSGKLDVLVISHDIEIAKFHVARISGLTTINETTEETVEFIFWNHTNRGGRTRYKDIIAPKLSEIEANYPTDVLRNIKKLSEHQYSEEDGKLIIWHGAPGVGKTYAIRSLARHWVHDLEPSSQVEYIIDPDAFFQAGPDYMIQVLLSESDDNGRRLLILEDAGELLTPDANDRMGQGLARLLNTVDGLIGQGVKINLLITTNEPTNSFHPAVIRPGRCLQILEFGKLTSKEATRWFDLQGIDFSVKPGQDYSLAELYAKKNDILREDLEDEKVLTVGHYL